MITYDESNEVYHANPAYSSSDAKAPHQQPARMGTG